MTSPPSSLWNVFLTGLYGVVSTGGHPQEISLYV